MTANNLRRVLWRKSSRSSNNGACVEVGTVPVWRKSSRSADNGSCVEVACMHDAPWRKSTHSSNNGTCLEAAQLTDVIAVRDSKLDTTGDFPVLMMSSADWAGLLEAVKTD